MGNEAWKPTKKDLKKITDLTALNASKAKISRALGIHVNTYNNYLKRAGLFKSQNVDQHVENVDPIKKAIDEGNEIRETQTMKDARESFNKQIKGYFVDEIEFEFAADGKTKVPVKGKTKWVAPVPMLTLVEMVNNCGYQSINKAEVKQENNGNSGGIKMELID